jgi:hypothetical protein
MITLRQPVMSVPVGARTPPLRRGSYGLVSQNAADDGDTDSDEDQSADHLTAVANSGPDSRTELESNE